jgi:glycine betaine/proline transport system permease protein
MTNGIPDFRIPVGAWVEAAVDWIQANFTGLLDGISDGLGLVIGSFEDALLAFPPLLLAALIVALAWWRVGWRFALFAVAAMALLFGMDIWKETVATLALVIGSSLVALAIGIPIGIAMARSDTVETVARPILDFMQTMPPFVYLIPAAIFFGLGKVPGAIATLIFAMPPAVRLTSLGIRQVSREHVEAGQAFGCTPTQLLLKVQLPLALPSIMAGINQTIMLALSMVVIASMIGAGGLGNTVLTGIQRLDVGLGFEGGLGVVLLAILLDRITQSFGRARTSAHMSTGTVGPLTRLRRLISRSHRTDSAETEKSQ